MGGATWEPDVTVGGVLPTGYMTLSSGEFRSEGEESAFSVITADGQPTGYCLTLNTGEKPRTPIPSKLSEILEHNPDHKYDLSPTACLGILKRAERRGKELPKELKQALELQARAREVSAKIPAQRAEYMTAQSAYRETESTAQTPQDATDEDGAGAKATPSTPSTDQPCTTESEQTAYSFDSLSSNSMKSANPISGCREVDVAKTLDCFDPNPSKNQGGIAVVGTYDVRITSDGTKNVRAHCYETEISRCLDTGGENPDSNHGGGGGHRERTAPPERELAAGFSFGQSEHARSIGYQEECSPTLRGGEGGNQKPCAIVCGNPWDAQSERVFHGDGAWHSLNSNSNGGQSRDAVLVAGFKAGQSKDGGIGYEKQQSPTLSATPSALEPTVLIFAQNQREEVRDLGDTAGAVSAETGTHQQTFVYEKHEK